MFKNAYIPRTLTEVSHYERDVDTMMKAKEEDSSLQTQNDNVSLFNPHMRFSPYVAIFERLLLQAVSVSLACI